MIKENEKLSAPGPHYSCTTCFVWVPESKVIIGDGDSGRFCGAECLEKWHAKRRENEQEKKIVTE